jgi:hypothetical protein
LRQFLLIDHSLQDLGGHHYPLAVSILEAAERAGFAPVLATHRDFRRSAALPRHWPVHALFKYRSYSHYALDTQASLQAQLRRGGGLSRYLRLRWSQLQRARIASRFARDCQQLFARLSLAADDLVLVATASELDLAGLARFLPASAVPAAVRWHLQFHFGIYRGRDPQYAAQTEARQAMADSLQASLRALQGRELRFYCTTEPLTRQYQQLGLAPFRTLPYPVHELFRAPIAARPDDGPARVACLGHARREKRHGLLPQLLRALWEDYFSRGKAQLVLQTDRASVRRQLQLVTAQLQAQQGPQEGAAVPAVSFASASLDLQNYARLLRSADIGLLLYDGERYYDRCSGVLLELLTSGIPVVVPAASWLAAQIAAINQRYLADLAAQLAAQQRLVMGDAAPAGGILDGSFGGTVPANCSGWLLELTWPETAPPGVYLETRLRCVDAQGQSLAQQQLVLGDCAPGLPARLLLPAAQGAARFELECTTAFGAPSLSLKPIVLHAVRGMLPPLGAVGITLAEPSQAAAALRDILDHREHYRRHSVAFAADVAYRHDAARLVELLNEAH